MHGSGSYGAGLAEVEPLHGAGLGTVMMELYQLLSVKFLITWLNKRTKIRVAKKLLYDELFWLIIRLLAILAT